MLMMNNVVFIDPPDLKNRETYGDICIYRLKKEWPSAIQDFYKKDLRVKKKSFVFK